MRGNDKDFHHGDSWRDLRISALFEDATGYGSSGDTWRRDEGTRRKPHGPMVGCEYGIPLYCGAPRRGDVINLRFGSQIRDRCTSVSNPVPPPPRAPGSVEWSVHSPYAATTLRQQISRKREECRIFVSVCVLARRPWLISHETHNFGVGPLYARTRMRVYINIQMHTNTYISAYVYLYVYVKRIG